MNIGIPKEIKDHEFLVALTPEGVAELVGHGHGVWIEHDAGQGSGFSDEDYRDMGGHVSASKEEVFKESDLLLKVKEPLLSEMPFFESHHTLFTLLHLSVSTARTHALVSSGLTAMG